MAQVIHPGASGTYDGGATCGSVRRRWITALIDIRNVWRERRRQRAELMALVRAGFDFEDIGITRALAAREAVRFPWQAFDAGWKDR